MSENAIFTLEGLTPEQLLALPREELDALVLGGEPLVFRAGSAEVLARFLVEGPALVLELAHIDGGGEGVLPALAGLAARYARREGLAVLDWRVHAVHCARPNPKLRRVLERRRFRVEDVPGSGACYRLVEPVNDPG
jgi:hypothetical protein